MKMCSIPGCERKHYARRFCRMHWTRQSRHGDTDLRPRRWRTGAPIEFIKKAILHKGNDCLFWPYAKNNAGYGHLTFLGKPILAHRMVLASWRTCPAPKMVAAHLCGNGHLSCINPQHLAWATQRENAMHRAFHLSAPGWT